MNAQRQLGIKVQRGFTLVELLLVMVILVVLAAVVVPKFVSRPEQAKEAVVKTDLSLIDGQLEQFKIDLERYPTSEEGLGALMEAPGGSAKWHGPYFKSMPKDPWGKPYHYVCPGTKSRAGFDLWSEGADGVDGTGDDVGNWEPKE